MCTLSLEESKRVRQAGVDLTTQDDPFCLSWAGLKCLDMTHVRVAYGSISTVDLSGNELECLPESFSPSLRHVQYLDLSRNNLMELPQNFGKMENLHTLILYLNKLETLPVSFRNLDNLRWLDISANPLEPRLLDICGDDLTYCEVVARNVVEFMRDLYQAKESTELYMARTTSQNSEKPNQIPEIPDMPMGALDHEGNFLTNGDSFSLNSEKSEVAKNILQYESLENFRVYEQTEHPLVPVVSTVLYYIIMSLCLFIFVSFSLALYNQGPPKGLLNGGKLQKYDKVPSWALNSFAWAVHICPKCIPYRNDAVETIVIPQSSFFDSFLNLFIRPVYNIFVSS